ncbi:hypothetical protein predicted by Glimmer/Critica [Sorangium cellulosum So ce56]|uniref:Uncharacterized protein n=1 Tax=Sorangium cellulosum (strain So ce56) TaxID=448385 RepID=A9F329_SORC5|nr:hypothetical protein predicted by Glimmer/Critica [Sorangium cellulosum So ce56]
MPTLMLFGHGAAQAGTSFDFRRPSANASKIYFWAAEGKPSKVYDEAMSSIIANAGAIPVGWSQEKSSRIGGAQITEHLLQDPTLPPNLVPWLPANFATLAHNTNIHPLNGIVYHSHATIIASNAMVFRLNNGANSVRLSAILNNGNFNNRPLNIAWLVCRV